MRGTKVAEIKSEHHTAHRVQTPKPGGEGGVGIHAMLGKKQPSTYSCTHPVTFRPGPCLTSFTNGPDVFENVIPPPPLCLPLLLSSSIKKCYIYFKL